MDTNLTLPQLHAVGLLERVQGSCGDVLPFGENTSPQMVTDWIAQSNTIYLYTIYDLFFSKFLV